VSRVDVYIAVWSKGTSVDAGCGVSSVEFEGVQLALASLFGRLELEGSGFHLADSEVAQLMQKEREAVTSPFLECQR